MKLTYYRQPTANSCGHTATAMLLSGFGITKTPQEVIDAVHVHTRPGTDEPWGSLVTDHGIYLMQLGLKVKVYSFDVWVTDMSWRGKDAAFMLSRIETLKGALQVPAFGKDATTVYLNGYEAFLKAGGELQVMQYPTVRLITDALKNGPLVASVNYQSLYGASKIRFMPDGLTTQDDDGGIPTNHSIIVSAYKDGCFEVYDPWHKERILLVKEQALLSAIMTAQLECDNQLLVIEK